MVTSIASFRHFNLSKNLLINLSGLKFLTPTEIQSNTFKLLSDRKSITFAAGTGTGKTLAYLLPLIAQLERSNHIHQKTTKLISSPFAFIIVPSTELAIQCASSLKDLTRGTKIKHHILLNQNTLNSKFDFYIPPNTDIVISTPSILTQDLFHLTKDLFSNTKSVVVDEVDLVLGNSFKGRTTGKSIIDVLKIARQLHKQDKDKPNDDVNSMKTPSELEANAIEDNSKDIQNSLQLIFCGATIPKGKNQARSILNKEFPEAKLLFVKGSHQTPISLSHEWIQVTNPSLLKNNPPMTESGMLDWELLSQLEKEEYEKEQNLKHRELLNIIREECSMLKTTRRFLVFANSIQNVEKIYTELNNFLIQTPSLSSKVQISKIHSKMSSKDRLLSFAKFSDTQMVENGLRNYMDESLFLEFQNQLSSFDSESKLNVLISGDVLARGCDFQNIDKVIQYDFATNIVTYLHRVGRTARMNSTGNVVHFIGKNDELLAKEIQKTYAEKDLNEGDIDNRFFCKLFSRNRSFRNKHRNKE